MRVLILTFALALTACGGELAPKSDPPSSIERLEVGDIKTEVTPNDQVTSRVKLTWSKSLGEIRITDDEGSVQTSLSGFTRTAKRNGRSYNFLIEQPSSGAKYNIEVWVRHINPFAASSRLCKARIEAHGETHLCN